MTSLGDALKAALAARKSKPGNGDSAVAANAGTDAAAPRPLGVEKAISQAAVGVRAETTARWVGRFIPNPMFGLSQKRGGRRIRPSHSGIEPQLTSVPSNAADIVLGLDFGTSTVKAVIRDATARQTYLVQFISDGAEPYLLPASAYRTGTTYSLDEGDCEISDIKLKLLACKARLPVGEFDDACAFLALVIRHCRGWFLDRYASLYRHHDLHWTLNVGVPASSYADDRIVDRFRRLAWAAANLASDAGKPQVRSDDVTLYRQLSLDVYRKDIGAAEIGDFEFQPADVDVVPEIAAQVHGFVQSSRWDGRTRPYMALMDIGAGTIDTAFFYVTNEERSRTRFVFYSSDVQPLGVVNLHRERLTWIRDAITRSCVGRPDVFAYLDYLESGVYRFQRVLESVVNYVPGLEYVTSQAHPLIDDEFFKKRVVAQLARCIMQGKMDHRFQASTLHAMRFFLCGGGSRMEFYKRTPAVFNENRSGGLSLATEELPVPPRFDAPSLPDEEFDRVSVAYGLSWPSLGTIIRPQDIPPLPPLPSTDYRDQLVGKEMV